MAAAACWVLILAPAAEGAVTGERAYEMVSPPDSLVDVSPTGDPLRDTLYAGTRASEDGDAIVYTSAQSFGGSEGVISDTSYVSTRGAASWTTLGLTPPLVPNFQVVLGYEAFTADLSKGIMSVGVFTNFSRQLDPEHERPLGSTALYLRDMRTGSWQLLNHGPTPSSESYPAGGSDDFSTVAFQEPAALTPDAPVGVAANAYEWNDGDLRLVGILPDDTVAPGGAVVGSGAPNAFYRGTTRNAVSDDGSQIVFTSPAHPSSAVDPSSQPIGQLYARQNGTTTVHVSESQSTVPDPNGTKPANYRGAASDGSKIFFTSSEKLTDDATTGPTSAGSDLYRYDTETGDLEDLSVSAIPGDGARVLGVPGVSDDGSRAYFVALGELAAGAVDGQPNLYLWDEGSLRFIATLSTGDAAVWAPEFVTSWIAERRQSYVSANGRSIVFSSIANATSYDAQGNQRIYLYDSEANGGAGEVTCPSCRAGAPRDFDLKIPFTTNGWSLLPQDGYASRLLSDDGEQLAFHTPERLLPEDVNGTFDVYTYVEGELRLLTPGTGDEGFYFADASADGGTVFFKTRAQLSPADGEDALDLYAARVGGGFPAAPDEPRPCDGDGCQGAPRGVPGASDPGSDRLLGPGDQAAGPRPRVTLPKLSRAQRARLARGRAVTLRVRVNRPGKATIAASARIGGRARTVGRAARTARKAGVLGLRLRLSGAARKPLAQGRKLSLRLTVRFGSAESQTQSFDLVRSR